MTVMPEVAYDDAFFEYTSQITEPSAREVVALLHDLLTIKSVLDVGCARGVWLKAWNDAGILDYAGVDGDHVSCASLLIDPQSFTIADLSKSFSLGRTFDLVQSLEVAEHLPVTAAETFIASLVRHGSIIFFSAAPPGQGGLGHVNERPYSYWRELFAKHGYVLLDSIRPLISESAIIAPWYRYNMFIYAHRDRLAALPEILRAGLTDPNIPVPDISPSLYKLRKQLIRLLPHGLEQDLAQFKTRMALLWDRFV
jgi:hypothetical protein